MANGDIITDEPWARRIAEEVYPASAVEKMANKLLDTHPNNASLQSDVREALSSGDMGKLRTVVTTHLKQLLQS